MQCISEADGFSHETPSARHVVFASHLSLHFVMSYALTDTQCVMSSLRNSGIHVVPKGEARVSVVELPNNEARGTNSRS